MKLDNKDKRASRDEVLDAIADSLLSLCYLMEPNQKFIDKFIKDNNTLFISNSEVQNFKNALSCFGLAMGIIPIRRKQGEKVEPIVRKVYLKLHEALAEDLGTDIADETIRLVKFYTSHWDFRLEKSVSTGDMAFRIAEVFIEPISELFKNPTRITNNPRIPLFLMALISDCAKGANLVLKNAKDNYGFEPEFVS